MASARAKILVADDEPNLRRVLTAILQRDGYEVLQAADGAEALSRVSDDVDVVITDSQDAQGSTAWRFCAAWAPSGPTCR